MPFDPFTTATNGLPDSHTFMVETLDDVLAWLYSDADHLHANTRRDYLNAVKRIGKHLKRPLTSIPATLPTLLDQFPDKEYTKAWGKSFDAFKRWKRNFSAAIHGASGEISDSAERRGRQDDWSLLIEILEDLSMDGTAGNLQIHEKEIIPVRALADVARRAAISDLHFLSEHALSLYKKIRSKGQRQAICDALSLCDRIRGSKDRRLLNILPKVPISFTPPTDVNRFILPKYLQEELDIWIDVATRGLWSPTNQRFTAEKTKSSYRNAIKKVLTTAARSGCLDIGSIQTVAIAFDDEVLTCVVRTLEKWHREKSPYAITPKTAAGYLSVIAVFLDRNGECSEHVRLIKSTDAWIASDANPEGLEKPTMLFCRRVVTDMLDRLNFLSLHRKYQKRAEEYLKRAKSHPQEKVRNLQLARQYGTCAAFAALETDAVPIRVSNALACTFRGKGAWLELGHKLNDDGLLYLPANATKNKKPIRAPIKSASRLRGLETLRWYLREIRPLFPHHEQSDFFFPSLKRPDAQLQYGTLKGWWSKSISDFGFPGLNPHMFRHGQASILVDNTPGDWQTVSIRLGDTEDTCKKFYAWINDEKLILQGQRRLSEGLPHAA